MSCISKQLAFSKLILPKDVLELIKDFVFQRTQEKAKRLKNIIFKQINDTIWTPKWYSDPKCTSLENGVYVFRLEKIVFFIPFCLKCGNYNTQDIFYHARKLKKIHRTSRCNCLYIL